jgi:hypothetical protein
MVDTPDPDPVWFQLSGSVGSRLGNGDRNDGVDGIDEMKR